METPRKNTVPERSPTWSSRWTDAGGLAAPVVVAVALWIVVVVAVASPLGDALARFDARRETPARAVADRVPCPVPSGALASATRRGGTCR